jgi:hypothetical protein
MVPSPSKTGFPDVSRPPSDPDLARLLACWPDLPKAIKAAILALVQAAGGPDA